MTNWLNNECPARPGDLIHIGGRPQSWHEPPKRLVPQNFPTASDETADQLTSLLETLEAGDIETAKEWLRAAIKLLERPS